MPASVHFTDSFDADRLGSGSFYNRTHGIQQSSYIYNFRFFGSILNNSGSLGSGRSQHYINCRAHTGHIQVDLRTEQFLRMKVN
ncbi:hypothetical protein D3C81_1395640 [compost metagenome]